MSQPFKIKPFLKFKPSIYEGDIQRMQERKIFLNVDRLEEGKYEVNIIENGKIINKVQFTKQNKV